MPTLNKLEYLDETKQEIKGALNTKFNSGITDEDTFRSYVDKIKNIYINWPRVTGENTELTLEPTRKGKMEIGLKPSALEQETTSGKNLVNCPDINATPTGYDRYLINNFDIDNTKTYTLSFYYKYNNTGFSSEGAIILLRKDTTYEQLTSSSDSQGQIIKQITGASKISLYITNKLSSGSIDVQNVMLEQGSTATEYEEYTGGQPSPNPQYPQEIHTVSGENTITIKNSDNTQSQTYPLSLGDLEYCKIGNYEDLFFKNVVGSEYYDSTLELDKWYLKKNIDKHLLIGDDINNEHNNTFVLKQSICSLFKKPVANTDTPLIMSTHLVPISWSSSWATATGFISINADDGDTRVRMSLPNMTIAEYRTWEQSNTLLLYYVKAQPQNILLSDTLQTQLDNIANALSYDEQTNISQTNDDLPFIISASVLMKGGN